MLNEEQQLILKRERERETKGTGGLHRVYSIHIDKTFSKNLVGVIKADLWKRSITVNASWLLTTKNFRQCWS